LVKWLQLEPGGLDELSRLIDTALELPADRRAQWLESLADGEIKSRLRSVLSRGARVETSDFLGALPAMKGSAADFDSLKNNVEKPGDQIGPYRLIREIGRGGMSAVWLAERTDGLIRRPVALKLPQGLWRRGTLAERFGRERNILAGLTHPHIARLYDAGIGAAGQPFLAIEYVEGQPIDAYCTANGLDLDGRLRLFLHVARAVAYAHAQLVVHRDLKPANILVTPHGEVRLLDFGIAKLLDPEQTAGNQPTEFAAQAFTPDYAAPEQIAGETVTTATDVYSLGVLLYELVSLARPYSLNRGSRAALEQAISSAEPPRPSALAGAPWRKQLRGDLDTIVLKALKKSPGERYSTVSALADDLERHLEHRPVLAQPDTFTYRLTKFVQRNRVLVAGLGVLTLAILASASAALWQAHTARAEARRASEIYEFLASTIRDADPHQGEGRVLSAAALLRQAHQRADSLREHPEQRVAVLTLIATSLLNLEDFDGAEQTATQALSESLASLGPANEQTVRARMAMVGIHRFRGRTREMRRELELIEKFLAASPSLATADRFFLLESRAHLSIDAGKFDEARAAAEQAFTLATAEFGEGDARTAAAAVLRAESYEYTDVDSQAALEAATRAFQQTESVHGGNPRHPRVIIARDVHGRALARAGDLGAGDEQLALAQRHAMEIFGPTSSSVGFISENLARYQRALGQIHAAIANFDRALAIHATHVDRGSFTYLSPLSARGIANVAARRGGAAVIDLEEASRGLHALFGAQNEETVIADWNLGLALAYAGRARESRAAFARALQHYRTTYRDPVYLPSRALNAAGTALRVAGDSAGAKSLHLEALEAVGAGDNAPRLRPPVLAELGLDHLALGDPREAMRYFEEAAAARGPGAPVITPAHADLVVGIGRAWLMLDEPRRALAPLEQADAFWRGFDPDNRWAGEAAAWHAVALAALGREGEAREARTRARALLSASPFAGDAALLNSLR
jgi:serine/threonine protein kinase/tetratricopeptide (TPR) repeat protein